MTKIEIIDETVEFYKNNPRSLEVLYNESKVHKRSTCRYLTDKGNKCAFARCCTDEGVKSLIEGKSVLDEFLQYLKPEYQGHSTSFWRDIQRLHDHDSYWKKSDNGNILTDFGLDSVRILKLEYCTT